jgi:hypothetical protein
MISPAARGASSRSNGFSGHQQDVVGRVRIEQRPQRRIGQIAAVPVGLALDLHRLEQVRQAGRGQQDLIGDLGRLEDVGAGVFHRGGGDEQLDVRGPHRLEVDRRRPAPA